MLRARPASFSNSPGFKLLQSSPPVVSLITIVVAGLVLMGWILNISVLKSLQDQWVTMKVNTAIAFLSAGLSLGLFQAGRSRRIRLARGLAAFTTLIGLLTLGQYVLQIDLGIDQLVMPDDPAAIGTSSPGRMAPNTALNFVLLGVALLLRTPPALPRPRRATWMQILACVIGVVAIQALIGYAQNDEQFFEGIASYTQMAVHTACLFLGLAWGILCCQLDRGVMGLVTSDRISGIMARRLLPIAIGTPLLLWWLIVQGSRLTIYTPMFGLSLLVVVTILVLTSLIWQSIRLLDRLETHRERVEAAFGEREAQLQLALDAAQMGTWEWDFQTDRLHWSTSHEQLFGLRPQTFPGTFEAFLTSVHPEDRQFVAQESRRSVERQTPYALEFRIVWPDGAVRWIASQGRCMYDKAGQPLRMMGVCMDITDQNEAEEGLQKAHADLETLVEERTAALTESNYALRQQILERQRAQQVLDQREQELSALLENTPDLIMRCDRQFRYVYVNPAVERITGMMSADFLGKTSQEMGASQDLYTLWHQTLQRVFETGQEQLIEFIAPTIQGDRHYQSRVVPEFDRFGVVQYALTVSRDITELKQAETERTQLVQEQAARAEAEATNRMKDEFLAVLSHELRTPLNAILGWARLLRTRTFDSLTVDRALDTIERNAETQAQLIEDILDVSRIIQGKLSLNLYPISLQSVMEAAIEVVRPVADAKSIQISITFDPACDTIPADPRRLQQVFWNVISNAVKFTPEQGQVSIVVSSPFEVPAPDVPDAAPVRCAQITITDTGKGIEPEFLPYVFDRFRQADSSTTRSYGGLGLGLAIVRYLVELHGGTVSASSAGPGQGATFSIKLPLEVGTRLDPDSPDVPGSHPTYLTAPNYALAEFQSPLALEGLVILVVDDEMDGRDFLTTLLEQTGAAVTAVSSVAEAMETLEYTQPDMVISDIGMPGEDGYQLLKAIQALASQPPIPVLAVTAYAKEEDRQQALAAGFQGYLCKPVRPTQLITAIAHLAITHLLNEEEDVIPTLATLQAAAGERSL